MVEAKKIVALDLDGTVVHYNETVDPELATALQLLDRDPLTEVIIATGRSAESTLKIVNLVGISPTWVICCNGAVIMHKDPLASHGYRREHVETFDPKPVLELLHGKIPGARMSVESGDGVFYFTAEIPFFTLPVQRRQVEFAELLTIPATRIVTLGDGDPVTRLLSSAQLAGINHVFYSVGEVACLDIAPTGVSKASALQWVNGKLGVSRANVFAAGDGHNDIDMFRWAGKYGTAVAMGQAAPDVKAVANRVTGEVGESGLLRALTDWHPLL